MSWFVNLCKACSQCMAPAAPSVLSPPNPVQPHLGTGAALQGQGSLKSHQALMLHTHHHAWEAPRPPFLIVWSLHPIRNPKGLIPSGLTISKLDCARKATYFPSPCNWLQWEGNTSTTHFIRKSVSLQKNVKLILLPFSSCVLLVPYLHNTSQHAVPEGCTPSPGCTTTS